MAAPTTLISIEIAPLPDRASLGQRWRALETRSDNSFFASWTWIGTWLDALPEGVAPSLISARDGSETVALGIVVSRAIRRHGLFVMNTALLNASGVPRLDHITIEFNDFAIDRRFGNELRRRMVEHVLGAYAQLDELRLDGVLEKHGWAGWEFPGFRSVCKRQASCYVDLDLVRGRAGDYLSLLSANTRAKIRRSHKEFERLGPVTFEVAADEQRALVLFDQLRALHQSYWESRGQPGAFSNEFFVGFHRRLLAAALRRGEVQLAALRVGEHLLGILYNFVHRGRVYNYQSGFDYRANEKHSRPGLIAHHQAVEFNAAQGYRIYDFMAGDYQYKRSLATHEDTMCWTCIQRLSGKLRAEDGLRAIKWRVVGAVRRTPT